MSDLQIIEELCGICADMAHIIQNQKKALAQYDALVLEDEIEKVSNRYQQIAGGGWPELSPEGR